MAVFPAFIGLCLAALVSGQGVEVSPREAVRRAGDEVAVLCKVAYPIDSCRMTVGQVSYRLIPSNQDGDVVYSGRGLEVGECGARIRNIREEWSGDVTCVLPPRTGNIELTGTMALLVAKQPEPPQLMTSRDPGTPSREGDLLEAQCIVRHGRPAARITWLLDDTPLVEGLHQPVVETVDTLATISQNVSRALRADDAGRRLVCRSEHEALDQPRDAAVQLQVLYPPKRLEEGPLTIFGLKLGAEGLLNVTVRANPPPQVEWTIGDRRLTPGAGSDDGAVRALEPIALGNGYYNCSLAVARVVKEDVERVYYLQVSNPLGAEQFALRLSTMDEPAGVELGTGAIVGIVIAVLILLTAVFLIVFAKATERWCFGENFRFRRDQAKSSGESTPAGDVLLEARIQPTAHTSETESAHGPGGASGGAGSTAGGGGRLAALRARVRAALPRGKDKVQASDDKEEKPLAEEKKNVVYAELALGEGREKAPPPPDAATEYAQIVYTAEGGPRPGAHPAADPAAAEVKETSN